MRFIARITVIATYIMNTYVLNQLWKMKNYFIVCLFTSGILMIKRGNGCGEGVLYTDQTTCFWLVLSMQNFTASMELCSASHGSLAVIPNQNVLDFLIDHRTEKGYAYEEFYIGYKLNAMRELVRLDGQIQSWAPWYNTEPGTLGDCVSTFNSNGLFWSEMCYDTYFAVCQADRDITCQCNDSQTTSIETSSRTTPVEHVSSNSYTTQQDTTVLAETTQFVSSVVQQETIALSHTTKFAETTSDSLCFCFCNTKHINLTLETKEEIAKNISKELSVDKTSLSSTIRSKTSASDDRPSAVGIGCIGAVLLVLVFGGIVLMDFPIFINNFKSIVKELATKWKRKPRKFRTFSTNDTRKTNVHI